jgi:hypothetical protein
MKKIVFLSIVLVISMTVSAKKVKFEVDMTDQVISTYGVHVTGDFQEMAGFSGGDWQPGTTELTQEPGTDIFSIVVDIPAFAKYEYKFLNGDQWYDVEFVPWESRVGYNFNDNRWIFVDSIANDTTTTYPILYSGNAPAGLKMLRLKVDLQKESNVNSTGVHVAGSFQEWNPIFSRLCDFDTTINEYMAYVEPGDYEFKYFNGNAWGYEETVPSDCAVNGNRWVNVVNDTVLDVVCFSECSACVITQVSEMIQTQVVKIYPNPASSFINIEFMDSYDWHNITIIDMNGRIVNEFRNYPYPKLIIDASHLIKGVYLVKLENEIHVESLAKLIIE